MRRHDSPPHKDHLLTYLLTLRLYKDQQTEGHVRIQLSCIIFRTNKEYLNSAANAAGISGSDRTNIFVKIFAARCARAPDVWTVAQTRNSFFLPGLAYLRLSVGRLIARVRKAVCASRRFGVRLALTLHSPSPCLPARVRPAPPVGLSARRGLLGHTKHTNETTDAPNSSHTQFPHAT
jgi:hypothetical protein